MKKEPTVNVTLNRISATFDGKKAGAFEPVEISKVIDIFSSSPEAKALNESVQRMVKESHAFINLHVEKVAEYLFNGNLADAAKALEWHVRDGYDGTQKHELVEVATNRVVLDWWLDAQGLQLRSICK